MAIDKFADRLLQHFDSILFCRTGIVIDKNDESNKKTVLFDFFRGGLHKLTTSKSINIIPNFFNYIR